MLEIVRAAILPSAYAEGFAFLEGVSEDETSSYRHQKKKGVPRRIRPKSLGRASLVLSIIKPSFLGSPKGKWPESLFWESVAEVVFLARAMPIDLAVFPDSFSTSSAVIFSQSVENFCLKDLPSRRAKASAATTSLGIRSWGLLKHFNLRVENASPSSSPNRAIPYSTMASLMNWFFVPLPCFFHSSSTAQAAWE